MDIDEVQAGRSSPMTQQSRLDVLALERGSKKRVGEEIDLADGEVVRGAPVGVHFAKQFGTERAFGRWLCVSRSFHRTGNRSNAAPRFSGGFGHGIPSF